jgi:hypothetical protein
MERGKNHNRLGCLPSSRPVVFEIVHGQSGEEA